MAYASSWHIPLCIILVASVVLHTNAHSTSKSKSSAITGIDIIPSVYISLNGTSLEFSGEYVSFTWGGVPYPQANDTIQVFSPSTADFINHASVKHAKCKDLDPTYLQTGEGSSIFSLLNLRSDNIVVLVHNETIVGMSTPLVFSNINQPLQGHLALTHSPSILSLTWTSLNSSNPTVQWGTATGNYKYSAIANTTTYTHKDMCDGPADKKGWYDPGLIHTAYITDLVPDQVYYYIYGDEEYTWSSEASFRGPKGPISSPISFDVIRLMAYGDMGQTETDDFHVHESDPGSGNTTANIYYAISDQQYDAILHIGDISYAVGYGSEWDAFFAQILPIATTVPYMVCPGNHEMDDPNMFWINASDSGGECGVPYRARFDMPLNPGPPSVEDSRFSKHHASKFNASNNWYSFDISAVHILMIDTEELFWPGSDQLNFIQRDLMSVDRQKTPYVIVGGHRPMYIDSDFAAPGNYSDQAVASQLRQYVEPLFHKYQVDLALWGHFHAYQRTCPIFNSECVEDGTTHMVIGMAGHVLSTNTLEEVPNFIEFVDKEHFGYITIEIYPEQMEVKYISDYSTGPLDSVIIPCKF